MTGTAGLQEAPRSWLLIPPEQAMSGHVEVLVSVRDTVLSIDELDSVDQVGGVAHFIAADVDADYCTLWADTAPCKRSIHLVPDVSQRKVPGLHHRGPIALGRLIGLQSESLGCRYQHIRGQSRRELT